MRREVVVLLLVIACGGAPPASTWKPVPLKLARSPLEWTTDDEDNIIGQACANIIDSSGHLRCDSLRKAGLADKDCFGSFDRARSNAMAATFRDLLYVRALLIGLANASSCPEVDASFEAARYIRYAPASEVAVVECRKRSDPFGPFALTADRARRRRGWQSTKFSDAKSSLDAPLEVCAVEGEMEWMLRATCNDGSRPFGADIARAHATRLPSPPPNNSHCPNGDVVLDKYAVPCPEQTYVLFFDMYECGPGEQF